MDSSLHQLVGACVFLPKPNGDLLVVRRPATPHLIGLPGGKVDPGEAPLAAAVRELHEETGYIIPSGALCLSWEAMDLTWNGILHPVFVFAAPFALIAGRSPQYEKECDPHFVNLQQFVAANFQQEFARLVLAVPSIQTLLGRVMQL